MATFNTAFRAFVSSSRLIVVPHSLAWAVSFVTDRSRLAEYDSAWTLSPNLTPEDIDRETDVTSPTRHRIGQSTILRAMEETPDLERWVASSCVHADYTTLLELPPHLLSRHVRHAVLRIFRVNMSVFATGDVPSWSGLEMASGAGVRWRLASRAWSGSPRALEPVQSALRELGLQVRCAVQGDVSCDKLFSAVEDAMSFGPDLVSRALDTLRDHGVDLTLPACGHLTWGDDAHDVGGGRHSRATVCDECFRSEYVLCADDDRFHRADDLYFWDSDSQWHLDEEPEPEVDDDDDYDSGYSSSAGSLNSRLDYSYNVMRALTVDPSFESSPSGDFHMGVELETLMRGAAYDRINAKVAAVRDELGYDYLIGKYDGSLGEYGIEWVTRPTSLATHIRKFGTWADSRKGLQAWDAKCCGTHVHIDSRAFTKLTLGKFLQFFNRADNADFIRGLAGRHPKYDPQAESYAGWDVDPETVKLGPLATLKEKASNASRYRMVNTTNLNYREAARLGLEQRDRLSRSANTVEVRIFRASMKRDRMLAQLEFTHALVVFCRTASYRDTTGSAFIKWLRTDGGPYPNLCKWFGLTVVRKDTRTASPVIVDAAPDEVIQPVPDRIGAAELACTVADPVTA